MKNKAELVFLDEFRSQNRAGMAWHGLAPHRRVLQALGSYPEVSDEELDDFQYEYLTGSDLATLTMPEIRWIIRHLISRSDFEWRKEEAEKMINEILEEREKEDT